MANATISGASGEFFVSGGTLSPDSASYIERTSDGTLLAALRKGMYCYILNSRQMGKSSLSVRTIAKLQAEGVRTAFVDLTQIGGRNVTPDQWYTGLSSELGRSLGVRSEMLAYCKQHMDVSPMQRFFGALREVIVSGSAGPLVVFIDEIDATKNLAFNTDEFFAGIRECLNRRVRDPEFKNLTFCLLGVAVPSDLISNPATTPFNVGERIPLQDFTLAELRAYAPALGPCGSTLIRRIHHWTNGQPYLTQSLCQIVASRELETAEQVDAVVLEQFFGPKSRDTNINLADVANRALNGGASEEDPERFRADLLSMYERAWKGGNVKDDEANRVAVVLKLSGLLRTEGSRLKVRNRIYQRVFDQAWIRDSMPGQELRRQEQSFRRGLARGALLTTAIVATVSILGLVAWQSRQDAVAAKRRLDYELYVADMSSMRLFEETGDIARMEQVLERTKGSPHRGIEWAFWNGRLHDSAEEYTLDYVAPGKREDGILSGDGATICITDALLGTVTVVDRRSKRALATRRLRSDEVVVSTTAGLLTVESTGKAILVRDLRTDAVLRRIGDGPHLPYFTSRRYGDFAFVAPEDKPSGDVVDWQIWNLCTGRMVWRGPRPEGATGEVQVSAKGERLFYRTVNRSGPLVGTVFDVRSGKIVDTVPLSGPDATVQLSESGARLLIRDADARLVARDVDAHRTLFDRPFPGRAVPTTVAFSPDDRNVLYLFTTGQAEVRDAETDQLKASRNNAWNVSASGDGSTMVIGSSSVRVVPMFGNAGARVVGSGLRISRQRGGLRVFRETEKRIDILSDPGLRVLGSRQLPPATSSVTYNGLWFLRRDRSLGVGSIEAIDGDAPALKVSPAPTNFAAGASGDVVAVLLGTENKLQGIARATGKVLWAAPYQAPIRGMWMSPDGGLLFTLSGDANLQALDPRTGRVLADLSAHNVRMTNVVFPNASVFFTCGADGRAILWDPKRLSVVRQFRGNAAQRISGADISPDGKRVATCSYTGAWQIWDAETGAQLTDFQASNLAMRGILFASDGKSIVTTGEDYHVKQWTTLSDDPSVRIPVPSRFSEGIKR